jgi:hypothetical protein
MSCRQQSKQKFEVFLFWNLLSFLLLFEGFRATSTATKCATVAAATTASITRRSIAKRVRNTPDNTGTVVNRWCRRGSRSLFDTLLKTCPKSRGINYWRHYSDRNSTHETAFIRCYLKDALTHKWVIVPRVTPFTTSEIRNSKLINVIYKDLRRGVIKRHDVQSPF